MIDEGRAKRYCSEDISKIENYDKAIADTTKTWICHHRTAIWWNCTAKDLVEHECYYHRKACELIFVTESEHKSLHHAGKTFSAETRQKLSESHKGKIPSEETKRKIAEANKGKHRYTRSAETKKKMSDAKRAYWAKRKEGGK